MKEIRITVRCTDEPQKHAKVLRLHAAAKLPLANVLAGLLDGGSPMYIHAPGPNSPVGRCCVCGARVKCEVEEIFITEIRPQEQVREAGCQH